MTSKWCQQNVKENLCKQNEIVFDIYNHENSITAIVITKLRSKRLIKPILRTSYRRYMIINVYQKCVSGISLVIVVGLTLGSRQPQLHQKKNFQHKNGQK
jgi:hypothetical protein